MSKKCNGQEIFLKSDAYHSTGGDAQGVRGERRAASPPRWRADRSRSPPPPRGAPRVGAGGGGDWGHSRGGSGKGYGKDYHDYYGGQVEYYDDFGKGYWAGYMKGLGKNKGYEAARSQYSSFGGGNGSGKSGDRKGGRKGEVKQGDRKGGRKGEGGEKSSADLDSELQAYFGGRSEKSKDGKVKPAENVSPGALDMELDNYMENCQKGAQPEADKHKLDVDKTLGEKKDKAAEAKQSDTKPAAEKA